MPHLSRGADKPLDQRISAKKCGWYSRDNTDYCPEHRSALAERGLAFLRKVQEISTEDQKGISLDSDELVAEANTAKLFGWVEFIKERDSMGNLLNPVAVLTEEGRRICAPA